MDPDNRELEIWLITSALPSNDSTGSALSLSETVYIVSGARISKSDGFSGDCQRLYPAHNLYPAAHDIIDARLHKEDAFGNHYRGASL